VLLTLLKFPRGFLLLLPSLGGQRDIWFESLVGRGVPLAPSVPTELNSCVKFGKFSCNINSSSCPKLTSAQACSSNSKLNSNSSPIAARLVFGRLKQQLGMPSLHEAVDDHDEPSHMPDQPRLVKDLSCSRCLGLGHLVSGCSSPVRCWHCFNYGHIKKSCLQWKASARRKWTQKKKTHVSSHALTRQLK
jgi:hypothetical protein